MANITDAEKIAHHWAERTVTAISWTGGLQFLVALLALCFSIWKHWAENKDEDKRRERAEDERRWGRMERRLERMEKAAQEAEARQDQAALQLERMVEALRADHLLLRDENSALRGHLERLVSILGESDPKIETLGRGNAELRRQMDSSPGWAPGGSGENLGGTGG